MRLNPQCPFCRCEAYKHSPSEVKSTRTGKSKRRQRYRCRNCHKTFQKKYTYRARNPKGNTKNSDSIDLIRCPVCDGDYVVKNGKSKIKGKEDKQRYCCRNPECRRNFVGEYTHNIRSPEIIRLFDNGETVQNISERFNIHKDKVVSKLKKVREW